MRNWKSGLWFLWWIPHRTREVIAAIGDGGNIIYVDRKKSNCSSHNCTF